MMSKSTRMMFELSHGYWLDEELTLKKACKSAQGKPYNKVIGYYGSLPKALKGYADALIAEGIHDGSLQSVNEAILRYENAAREIDRLARTIRLS